MNALYRYTRFVLGCPVPFIRQSIDHSTNGVMHICVYTDDGKVNSFAFSREEQRQHRYLISTLEEIVLDKIRIKDKIDTFRAAWKDWLNE